MLNKKSVDDRTGYYILWGMVLNSNLYNGNVSSIHKNIKKIEVRKTNSIDGFFAKR